MNLFGRRNKYDRKILLQDAHEAQRRGKHKKAIAKLRRVLTREPNNSEIHAMIAPSLAARGLEFNAWESYLRAARAMIRNGKKESAIKIFQNATQRMPRRYEAWTSKATLERRMGRKKDAIQTLGQALPHFRRRATRHPLISLLRLRLQINPMDRETTLELSSLLSKTGQKEEAKMRLAKLAESSNGRLLRQVRRNQWSIEPSLVHSWLWLRSCVAST
ncbi:MAG: tetratricopeptide repeat protein [Deltaproteobacteria bacterium]|nr:tetratricopeptide repeat protein [Deltaproteobacteria bacterium]